ncbi:MAG TPA: type II secretion system F family protein [Kiritimatiellia bacterium]|nr:type II secretion system F family protein [Kiritimatiellia bacterium]
MPVYQYRAIDSTSGKSSSGTLDVDSPEQLKERLATRNLIPVSYTLKAESSENAWKRLERRFNKVPPDELILFTKQIETMLRAGIPVLRAFDILASQTEHPRLKEVCTAMGQDIRQGSTLHQALARHDDVFPPLYSNMVRAGETSGSLPKILQRLIYVIAHEYKVRSDVRSVMQYPILVLVTLSIAFIALIGFVMPKFAAVFTKAGIDLPMPTRVCIALSDTMRAHGLLIFGGILLSIVTIALLLKTPAGKATFDRFILGLPLIGDLIIKASLSRLASIFAILQASGVSILEGLGILSGTINNGAISKELDRIKEQLEQGQGLAKPLSQAKYFTPMFINMVSIGEESGNLDEMLAEISNHYDAEVEYSTKKLTGAIGPALIVCLAAIIGFFALAVYLPMWDIAKLASKPGA